MTNPFISIQNLAKDYGEKRALRDINLEVERGDFFTVIGSSGAGKTTLLRLLDLLEESSEGHILFQGVDTTTASDRERLFLRRRIGMVFQKSTLFNASVFDNVAYPLRIRGVKSEITRTVGDVLERVGLTGLEMRNATTLSGGESQRVSLAQTLVFTPELLLLDEPTANLDPKNASTIEDIVSRISRENGVTIVMATHNMSQAERLSSKMAILHEGSLAGVGEPNEILGKTTETLASFAEAPALYRVRKARQTI